MLDWSYKHEIEYRREIAKGHRVHEYTEHVNDQGFVFEHRPEHKQCYLVAYTHLCAVDYFQRVHPTHGIWVVSAYRLLEGERKHLVTIKMRWPVPPGAPPLCARNATITASENRYGHPTRVAIEKTSGSGVGDRAREATIGA